MSFVLFTTAGCSSDSHDDESESYFVAEPFSNAANDGVISDERNENWEIVNQTMAPEIEGVHSVRVLKENTVIIYYDSGKQKEIFLDDNGEFTIDYFSKHSKGNSRPCIIRNVDDQKIYIYDNQREDFKMIADDFLFYLEEYEGNYYYVNSNNEFVDTEGKIYFSNVKAVKSDCSHLHTTIYTEE